ncbi:MAG: BON domain-containing protein [Acidobacteria bacterium]|nr:BON domain-containing protein [Acidobacteriota bacterium]
MRTLFCLSLAVVLVGCGRPSTEDNVREALDEADIRSVDVAVDEDANVVHLSGTVETLADRTRAEEIAAATVGTSGRVLNDVTVETLEEAPPEDPDQAVARAIDRLIDEDPVLRERDVNIAVTQGRVTVTGEVRSAAEKARADRIVSSAPGVAAVANELRVRGEP